MFLRTFWLVLVCFSSQAATFQPSSIEAQLKEADGVIIGYFLKSKSIVLDNGKVATQMMFKMNKEFGLQSDFYGMDEVIIHYPGGTIDGKSTVVDGVPKFVVGEKIALLTKNVDNRYWALNLGLGTYKIINYGHEVMLINSLFPEDPKVGQMRLEDFEKTLKVVKGSHLKVVRNIQTPDTEAAPLRGPASVSDKKSTSSDSKETPNSLSTLWLIGFLAFSGGLFKVIRKKGLN